MKDKKKQEFILKISQANRTQMLVIIYDILLEYLEEATKAEHEKQKDQFKSAIINARNCVNELIDSLNVEYELANGLLQIYLYLNRELARAYAKKSQEPIIIIQKLVMKLKMAYVEAAKTDHSSSVMGNTQSVYAGLTYGKGVLNESMENPIENRGFRV